MSNSPSDNNQKKPLGCWVKLLAALGLVPLAFLGWLWWNYPETTLRYRLTVSVTVDGRLSSGSGVWEVSYVPSVCWGICRTLARVRGEAFPIPLDSNRRIWVLLRGTKWPALNRPSEFYYYDPRAPEWLAPAAFERSVGARTASDRASYVRSLRTIRGEASLDADDLPQLAILQNENDPNSVRWIELSSPIEILGMSVRFVSASIAITDARPDRGASDELPWLDDTRRLILSPLPPGALRRRDFNRID
jgi:hypothetical protein